MRLLVVPIVLAAVALTGCASTSTSSTKYTGAAADVDKAINDLHTAGQRKDSAKLCSQILAGAIVTKLGGSAKCQDAMDKLIADADEFTMDVRSIKVNGSQATASIRQGDKGATRTLTFTREANRWKVSSFQPAS